MSKPRRERSCVIVVENLAVPIDRRVWQEAQALTREGWSVSVICPMNDRYPASFEVLDGIAIYRHPLFEAAGHHAYFLEYAAALYHEFRLLIKVQRERGFSVVQACNPPDLIFLAVLPFKLLGKRFVFDHHDVVPELYVTKFHRKGLFHRLLLLTEWLTFKCADFVISANSSFRDIAIGRGGKSPDQVETVYSIPDKFNMYRTEPDVSSRNGRKMVLGYLGIIGNQDGVDEIIRVAKCLIKVHKFTEFQAVIIGDGPALKSVRALAKELCVEDHVTFTGYLTGETLMRHISDFDVGIIPDPINESNDLMSMNKVFEYSALGIPTVSYPLKETKRLLGGAAIYAEEPNAASLAEGCLRLFLDEDLRKDCSRKASALARESFSWQNESVKYVGVMERMLAL